MASQLLKYCHWQEDTLGHAMDLRFLRDTDKREIDFVVLRDRRPVFRGRVQDRRARREQRHPVFAERTPIPRYYQVHLGERHFATGTVTVLPFHRFCQDLELP